MTIQERAEMVWLWKNIDKLTNEEYETFCRQNGVIAVAERELHKLYLAVRERVGSEVAE